MQMTKQINLKKIEKAPTFGLTGGFGLTDFVELASLDYQTMATNFLQHELDLSGKQINLKKIEKAPTFGLTGGFGLTDFVELASLGYQTGFPALAPACVNQHDGVFRRPSQQVSGTFSRS